MAEIQVDTQTYTHQSYPRWISERRGHILRMRGSVTVGGRGSMDTQSSPAHLFARKQNKRRSFSVDLSSCLEKLLR